MLPNLSGAPRGSETILLMDADPQTRKLALFMLGKQGYTVLEARNRAEAQSLFDRSGANVELLLLEAKGRGRELAEQLRRIRPETAVLFLCSESIKGGQFDNDPRSPVLKKPFTMHEIAGRVRQVLDSSAKKVMSAGGGY